MEGLSIWTLMHVNGCGKPCFRRTRKPELHDKIDAQFEVHLDGTPCKQTDPIICESCQVPLNLVDVHPRNWIEGTGQ